MSYQCNKFVVENKIGEIKCSVNGRIREDDRVTCICEEDKLIEMRGVCTPEKVEQIETGDTWTQIFIPEILCIPDKKPDVEEVMEITARVDIISKRVIKTPKITAADGITLVDNFEGTKLTGRKLVIEGVLRQKIIYTADVPKQSVHSADFDVPFSVFIVLAEDAPLGNVYKVEPCIEDIFVCRVSRRQIFKNVTLFIKATELDCL